MPVIDGGPEVHLRNWFERPYDDARSAARTCYSSRVIDPSEITEKQRENIGPLTFDGGHHTVFQHATFEFALSGISRQLVWSLFHSFPFYNTEQQSQRYVRLDEPRVHIPPALQGEARVIYEKSIDRAWSTYSELTERLKPVTHGILSDLWRLKDRQSKAFGRNVAKEAEKKAIETARYVIPIACHTAMVYTVSGIVLHRLRRMARACDTPSEAMDVVSKMVAAVEARDSNFFQRIGETALEEENILEFQHAPNDGANAAFVENFDRSLEGRWSKLIDYNLNAPAVIAGSVRSVLGREDLSDEQALNLVLNPAQNSYRLDVMNVGVHSPLMRTLNHGFYVFRKRISHTADSQDQRHRMVPGSRPLLMNTVPDFVDVVEPELIRNEPSCHALFQETMEEAWHTRSELLKRGVAPELALYVLPNALAVRFEESGSLLHLMHKWTMRTCLNAQREIFDASMDEIEQVRSVHPDLMHHIGPPCFIRSKLISPRCTEGSHFCGVPVWRSFPNVQRVL